MRISGHLFVVAALLLVCGPAAGQKKDFPAPVHPDTLPTLIRSWSLPASLAPYVTNDHAPRIALQGTLLFVYDHHGRRLAAVEALNGKVKWHKPIPSISDRAFAFTPLVMRSRVFVACDGYIYGFNTVTGKKVMQMPTKGIAVNGFGRSKHRLYLPWIKVKGGRALPGVQIWAIDTRRGRVEWNKKFPGTMGYVTGDSVGPYYVSNSGVVLGLTSDRGEPRWQVRVKGTVKSPPILKKNTLYIMAERRKAGWLGTGLYAIDTEKGKLLWQTKISHSKVHMFLAGEGIATIDGKGRLVKYGKKGKKDVELSLRFGDEPTTVMGTAIDHRGFVFSSHADGHGYVWLLDLAKKKVLTAANALNLPARSWLPAGKMLFIDGKKGNVYGYRLDKSQRPKRMTVPPQEFAQEMLEAIKDTKVPVKGMANKLAGLGDKALPAIEPGLESENPHVVTVAAEAIGYRANRRSVPALIKAIKRLREAPTDPKATVDPLLPVMRAAAAIRDGRAVKELQKVLDMTTQTPMRRRLAYVALGAIGTPAALSPLWNFRAAQKVATMKWDPVPMTHSYAYKVEEDVPPLATTEEWPEAMRNRTSRTIQTKDGKVFSLAMSPYLGGYNDLWFGRSDLNGVIQRPWFTGLTKPELEPNRRLRIKKFEVTPGGVAKLAIEIPHKDKDGKDSWVTAKPVELSLAGLAKDYDGDKLPDVVERRLNLCVTNADCDGDGLSDAEDINPLASSKRKPTLEQALFQESFFTYFSFLQRRGIVVVDPGDDPSVEYHGRRDPVLSLRRKTVERFRREVGLHAVDFVTFGGPYPEGGGSGDASPDIAWNRRKTMATIGMDIFRSSENAVAYNVTLKKVGKNWVVSKFDRVWTTN